MPPSAVVDASVLVSAFLFPGSLPGRVVAVAGAGAYALHLSPILLEEVRRSLRSPRLKAAYGHTDQARIQPGDRNPANRRLKPNYPARNGSCQVYSVTVHIGHRDLLDLSRRRLDAHLLASFHRH